MENDADQASRVGLLNLMTMDLFSDSNWRLQQLAERRNAVVFNQHDAQAIASQMGLVNLAYGGSDEEKRAFSDQMKEMIMAIDLNKPFNLSPEQKKGFYDLFEKYDLTENQKFEIMMGLRQSADILQDLSPKRLAQYHFTPRHW